MPRFGFEWSSPKTKFYILSVFLILVALTGGGSRSDIQSLVILRPVAFIFIAYGLVALEKKPSGSLLTPIFLLSALAIWILIQMVPIPYEYWEMLPGRERYAELLETAKIDGSYMATTLSASKSWNSFWSLSIPMALLLMLQNQAGISFGRLLMMLCGIWALGLIFATFQFLLGSDSLFYLYRITNAESPVGLFANRNHFALGLSLMILALSAFISNLKAEDRYFAQFAILALALMIMALLMSFLTGSRSGLITSMIASITAIHFIYTADFWSTKNKRYKGLVQLKKVIISAAITVAIGVVALVIFLARDRSLARLLESSGSTGLRGDIFPILTEMVSSFFPLGSGFGTFEHVFRPFEPDNMLSPFYLNNAHNDWLQFLIEGGLPALIILVILGFWLILRVRNSWRQSDHSESHKKRAVLAASSIGIIALASLTDYPLRVPYIMCYFVVMIGLMADIFGHRKRVA